MSSEFPPTGQRAEVPQPVKKRGRFSFLDDEDTLSIEDRHAVRETRRRDPAIVRLGVSQISRYELDEENSDDDPDFQAETDAVEDDDDDQYDQLEIIAEDELAPGEGQQADGALLNFGSHIRKKARRRRSTSHTPISETHPVALLQRRDAHYQFSGSPAPFQYVPGEDPEFEVDDLDSTDEEGDLEESEKGRGEEDEIVPGVCEDSGIFSGGHEEGDLEVDELDEPDSDEDEEDADEEEGEVPDEYQQFLIGLLADTGDPQQTSEQGGPGDVTGGLPPPNWSLDDDDDFDYLRESARVQDDPLEYRDDLQVSRKELVQLISNSNPGGLRRQTRHARAAHGGPPRQLPPAAVPVSSPGMDARRAVLSSSVVPTPTALAPGLCKPGSEAVSGQSAFQSLVGPPHASFVNLPAHSLFQFREQLAIHVQILTTIHAETCRTSRPGCEENRTAVSTARTSQHVSGTQEAANRSEALLRGLIENMRVSSIYYKAIEANLSRLKGFSEKLLHRDIHSPFKYESCKSSVYNLPVLQLLEGFIADCKTTDVAHMPVGVLRRFEEFNRPDIAHALRARPQRRQYSATPSRPGWLPWTVEDDRLLAMTMAKYGSEAGEFSKDLLPHRQEDDCQTRVRYLSSRRCPDNPVKRQAMFITSPLNKEEVALVRRGLDAFGCGNTEDASVWKRIQAELLPGREWSHLQKLWNWRETRRKYKAKYRAKAYQKKKAMQEGAAPA